MWKTFVVIAALLAPAVASAAGLQERPFRPQTFNWSGAYVGGQIGGAWGGKNDDSGDPDYISIKPSGFIGGLYAGYNWQFPGKDIVFGVETDFVFSGAEGSAAQNAFGYGDSQKLDWYGAVRGRIGYAFDRFLPFVAGGFAYGKQSISFTYPSGAVTTGNETMTGWTLGAGIDYAFTNNIVVRIEYRYTDFGSTNVPMRYGNIPWGELESELAAHDVRVGLSYKF